MVLSLSNATNDNVHTKGSHLQGLSSCNLIFRYMVATKDIKAGELIFKNDPLSVGANQNAKCVCIVCFDQVNI